MFSKLHLSVYTLIEILSTSASLSHYLLLSDRPFQFYDLTKDAEVITEAIQVPSKPTAYSRISHWPPTKKSETKLSVNE
jgi:hypothetical protein